MSLDGEIERSLRYAMALLGMRAANLPNPKETNVLLQFIRKGYGNHTVEEIRLAFDMAVSGNLDLDDVNPYENFSCAYFAKIMSAYRKWAADEHKEKINALPQTEANEDEKEKTMVDWSEQFVKLVKQAKNGIIRKEFINTDIYEWLMKKTIVDEATGEILPMYEYSKGEKWEILFSCMRVYLGDMNQAVLHNEERGIVTPQEIRTLIRLMECAEVDAAGNVKDANPWLKNPIIMSHLTTMSKQEIVYQIALSEAANL